MQHQGQLPEGIASVGPHSGAKMLKATVLFQEGEWSCCGRYLQESLRVGPTIALGVRDAQFISCGHSMGKVWEDLFLRASRPLALLSMPGVLTNHETH